MFGVNLDKWTPTSLIQESDRLLVVAYPTFNPKEELGATLDLYQNKARDAKIPILIFNGAGHRLHIRHAGRCRCVPMCGDMHEALCGADARGYAGGHARGFVWGDAGGCVWADARGYVWGNRPVCV
eukprot:365854-Chlamydomonas_euryale.AAC.4